MLQSMAQLLIFLELILTHFLAMSASTSVLPSSSPPYWDIICSGDFDSWVSFKYVDEFLAHDTNEIEVDITSALFAKDVLWDLSVPSLSLTDIFLTLRALFYGYLKYALQAIYSECRVRFYFGFGIWLAVSPQESSVDTVLLWNTTWWFFSGLFPSSASQPHFQPGLSSHPQIPKHTLLEWTSWQMWDYGL